MRCLLPTLLPCALVAPAFAAAPSADTTDIVVDEADWSARTFIAKRDTVAFEGISGFFANHLGAIYNAVQSSGMSPTGAPSGLYWHWDMENMRTFMAAALPVGEVTAAFEDYEIIDVPAGKALVVDHTGPYENMMDAHNAIDAHIAEHGMGQPTVVVEEYLTDPGTQPDPSKWKTRISYVFTE